MASKKANHTDVNSMFHDSNSWLVRLKPDSLDSFEISNIVRRGFLAQACPVFIGGISGPGAPHWCEFQKRESLGTQVNLTVGFVYFHEMTLSSKSLRRWDHTQSPTGSYIWGNGIEVDNKFWFRAPEHPEDVILRSLCCNSWEFHGISIYHSVWCCEMYIDQIWWW